MPPLWKLPRELWRIWQQISYVFVHPVELLYFEAFRRLKPSCQRRRAGIQPLGSDVAVFLVYQPVGLTPSTIETCAHLVRKGYSVVLVSNSPVSSDDWAHVAPHAAALIERPNFGYDFGGYRQVILEIFDEEQDFDNLLIMNDSIRLPIFDDTDLLDRMRDAPAPVTGPLIYHNRTPRRTHLQSYMTNLDRTVIYHEVFRRFWTNYSQTNNKIQTIRRGEMGLSAALRDAGFELKAIFSQDQVLAAFRVLSGGDLRDVLVYEAARNQPLRSRIQKLLSQSATDTRWREVAISLLDDPDWRRYFLTNHTVVSLSKIGFPMLKKVRGFEYRLQRRALLAWQGAADLPAINPEVLDEVRALI